jgi:uncharacterized protein with PIN domain
LTDVADPRFIFEAMLGGLARRLRTAGYDASWQQYIHDRDLINIARQERRLLLSSDAGIFERGVVRDGELPALFVASGPGIQQQLVFVMGELNLAIREPRCMACGGQLVEIPKEQARGRVPARSFKWQDRFWECDRCRRVFWRGTHWQRIVEELKRASGGVGN